MVNRGKDAQTIILSWTDAGLAADRSVAIRDLWEHKDLGTFKGSFSAPVPSHGTVMIRMK
jgi:alpha-galactosidase